MNLNEIKHGFKVMEIREVDDPKATMYLMKHEITGAELVWLKRDDDNKSFAIAFKTIPTDDTGVFHILEHSVLNGSEKYRVKEPFVELLKSSLQTFLNAMTATDKTMYPVSSRNPQDFLNLIDVYLDAVFHPLCIQDPFTFQQEGWRYELDESGQLIYNGVVYNEMKGVYASPDELLITEAHRLMFPDNCYGLESGGHPDSIPDLTYESFVENYKKHYHPTNSKIMLDGEMDIDAVLSKIDSYISEFGRGEILPEIPFQNPVMPEERTISYEISPEEKDMDRVILGRQWKTANFDETEKLLAFGILQKALCGTNESPIKKALLDEGLAEDVDLFSTTGNLENTLELTVWNTTLDKKEKIDETITRVLTEQASGKLDHESLEAILNKAEFKYRERDFGTMPPGLVYGINILYSWIYGGDPLQNICIGDVYQSLREKINKGYFEDLIRETILESNHKASVCLVPSTTIAKEKAKEEREKLDAIWESWTDDEKEDFRVWLKAFKERQGTADTPENLKTIPKLRVEDIPHEITRIKSQVTNLEIGGGRDVPIVSVPIDTGGITYLDLFFDISHVPLDELAKVTLYTSLLGDIETESYSLEQLKNSIDFNLGSFKTYIGAFNPEGDSNKAKPYAIVSISLMNQKKKEAVSLLDEILNRSKFTDTAYLKNIVQQEYLGAKQSVMSEGHNYAKRRALSTRSVYGAIDEAAHGIMSIDWIKEASDSFAETGAKLCEEFGSLSPQLFDAGKLTIGITGELDMEWLRDIARLLPSGFSAEEASYAPLDISKQAFKIPADTGFAATGICLGTMTPRDRGICTLASQIMTYNYLWNSVRVSGGAYGASMVSTSFGEIASASFRDPQTGRTIEIMRGLGDAIVEFAKSPDAKELLPSFIISTIGRTEPLMTPKLQGTKCIRMYMNDVTWDDLQGHRDAILNAKPEDLEAFGLTLSEELKNSDYTVVAGEKQIEDYASLYDEIKSI